jgi:hypothetical protein
LDTDVEDVETAECYAGIVNGKQNRWEAQPCYDAQWVDEDVAEMQ